MNQMTPEVYETLKTAVEFTELSSALVNRASDIIGQNEKRAAEIASAVSDSVNDLVSSGLIPASREQAARTKLASHEGALSVVNGLIKRCQEFQKLASTKEPGVAVSEKTAGVNPPAASGPAPFRPVGARSRFMSESDINLARSQGIDV
jgi:hypothetical protein